MMPFESDESAPNINVLGLAQLWAALEPPPEGEHTLVATVIGYVTTFVSISFMPAIINNINHKQLWHPIIIKYS